MVRRQAHALRHKLQEYYAGEGRDSAVRIELPVGKYVPVFRRQKEPVAMSAAGRPRLIGKSRPFAARTVGLAALFGVLLFAAGWIAGRKSAVPAVQAAAQKLAPAVVEIWGPWLQDRAGAVICFSNPLTTVVKYFQKEVPLDTLPRRFRPNPQAEKLVRQIFELPPGWYLYMTPSRAQGKMGEAISAVHLARLLARAGLPVRTTQSRFLDWEDLRSENLILLGHNEANQWLDPLLERCPLRLAATDGDKPRRILNLNPA